MKNYEKAKIFYDEHGHFPTNKENKVLNGLMVTWWRETYLKNPSLHQEKAEMLTAIGFTYQSMDDRNHKFFMKNYAEAKAFYDEHGHFPTKKENARLNRWARRWWRNIYQGNRNLHQEKADMLIAIEFVFQSKEDTIDEMFFKNYEEVEAFFNEYGYFPTYKENEKLVKGPREGLIENIIVNVSLIRNKIKRKDFKKPDFYQALFFCKLVVIFLYNATI